MQSRKKLIQFNDAIERRRKREEVKDFFFGTDECEFDEISTDEKCLCSRVFKNTSNLGVFVGLIMLIALVASLGTILFGWLFFGSITYWIIGIAISFMVLATLNPLIKFFTRYTEKKNYHFILGFTQDFIVATTAPKNYFEPINISEILDSESYQSAQEIAEAYKLAREKAKEVSLKNFENGAKSYHISRYAKLSSNKEFIILTYESSQMILPYDKYALRFLKSIALLSY